MKRQRPLTNKAQDERPQAIIQRFCGFQIMGKKMEWDRGDTILLLLWNNTVLGLRLGLFWPYSELSISDFNGSFSIFHSPLTQTCLKPHLHFNSVLLPFLCVVLPSGFRGVCPSVPGQEQVTATITGADTTYLLACASHSPSWNFPSHGVRQGETSLEDTQEYLRSRKSERSIQNLR